jgi:hypothetical protein
MKALLLALVFSLGTTLAQPATISTITCAGGVATVNVANSLVASQGFEITGSSVSTYNINGTAVSATSASFTFKVTCAGSATGGSFQPAQQILVQGINATAAGVVSTLIFWATTTTPTACPLCTSQWSTITAAQLATIRAGTTVEFVQTLSFALGTTTTQMLTAVLGAYAGIQAEIGLGLNASIGLCYNGTTWGAACN